MEVGKVSGMAADASALLNSAVSPEETADEKEVEQVDIVEDLLQMLEGIEGAPNRLDLDQWKAQYGKFFASSIHGDDIYIWRTLKRSEYKQFAQSGAMEYEHIFKESVVRKCLLYPQPTPEFVVAGDAGVIPTLFEQIYFQSGFVNIDHALSLIRRI